MGVNRPAVGDCEAFCPQGLEPHIIGARGYRALDPLAEKLFESREQDTLQLNRQRQQAIEEGGDRRQIIPHAIRIHQANTNGCFK